MSKENHEQLYTILMDLKSETGGQTAKLDSIEKKLDYTHGKVGKAIEDINTLQNWRWYILGGLAVLTVTGFAYFESQIEKGVKKYLTESGYDTIIIENK